eukprot:45038-Prymnesium_polylepis.2
MNVCVTLCVSREPNVCDVPTPRAHTKVHNHYTYRSPLVCARPSADRPERQVGGALLLHRGGDLQHPGHVQGRGDRLHLDRPARARPTDRRRRPRGCEARARSRQPQDCGGAGTVRGGRECALVGPGRLVEAAVACELVADIAHAARQSWRRQPVVVAVVRVRPTQSRQRCECVACTVNVPCLALGD